MRENMGLYRGKRTDNGEWVKGFYVHLYDHKGNESHRIYPGYAETDCGDYYPDWFEVDPETVGQFTVLTDKKGTNVFEGDIIRVNTDGQNILGWVSFERSGFHFRFGKHGTALLTEWAQPLEVIGNIHDNPELLTKNTAIDSPLDNG